MKIEIEITEAQAFALKLVMGEPNEWYDNALTNRARKAMQALKVEPKWMQAAQGLVADGGNITDDWAVLLKGRDMGLFKTANQVAAEQVDINELI